MDGECDIHHVTVSTTLLFAINSSGASKQYRYVSLSWPGMIGVLSSVNETEIYSTENAGPSQIGAQVKRLTSFPYMATHLHLKSLHLIQTLNNHPKCWPTDKATSELKGPICSPVHCIVTKSNTYWSVEHIRSLLQSACKGHTKHTIEHQNLECEQSSTNEDTLSVYNFIGAAFLACKPESLEHLFVGSANVLINDGMARASPTTSYRSVDINCILFAPPCVVSIDSMVMQ
ncbi:unnamed protein product [Adineta ricciae]|uniref:Uncharacterized protein n=1 Tax=Adineta ricciae TaxID=249248 RepID=A0A815CFS1_ADIRI|nr:unnamed protein product [Adineta ricciae]